VYFSIVDQDFLPQDQQLKITQNWLCLDKIWFGHSISFEILQKPQLECQNCLRLKISVLAATQRQSFSTVELQFWQWISSIMSYVYDRDAQARSGQKFSANNQGPLLTIPYFNYPITQQQIEGFLLDSWAVYRRWQPSE
jgi:hypothetical protein